MSFINHSGIAVQHPNAFVIASGGVIFEIESFTVGSEFRQGFYKGIISKIESDYFTMHYDVGFSIDYPLPYEITEDKHLILTDETMYRYGFWKMKKEINPVQLSLF